MQLDYAAPQHVRDVVARLGRTEDVKFSPSNRRLAIAGFSNNKIAVFDVNLDISQNTKTINLTDVAEIYSTYLNYPHGIDFLDDETIIVANRGGNACILKLPPPEFGRDFYELTPLTVIPSGDILVTTPGSVCAIRRQQNLYDALICNNYTHCVTSHLID